MNFIIASFEQELTNSEITVTSTSCYSSFGLESADRDSSSKTALPCRHNCCFRLKVAYLLGKQWVRCSAVQCQQPSYLDCTYRSSPSL